MTHEQKPSSIETSHIAATASAEALLASETWWESKRLSLGTGTITRTRVRYVAGGLEVYERTDKHYILSRLKDESHTYTVVKNALLDSENAPGMVTSFSWPNGDDELHVSQTFGSHNSSEFVAIRHSPEAQGEALFDIDKADPAAQWEALVALLELRQP